MGEIELGNTTASASRAIKAAAGPNDLGSGRSGGTGISGAEQLAPGRRRAGRYCPLEKQPEENGEEEADVDETGLGQSEHGLPGKRDADEATIARGRLSMRASTAAASAGRSAGPREVDPDPISGRQAWPQADSTAATPTPPRKAPDGSREHGRSAWRDGPRRRRRRGAENSV